MTNNVAMLVSLVLEVTIAAWNSPQNRMPRLASCTSFCLHSGTYPSPEAASMEDAEDAHFCKAATVDLWRTGSGLGVPTPVYGIAASPQVTPFV